MANKIKNKIFVYGGIRTWDLGLKSHYLNAKLYAFNMHKLSVNSVLTQYLIMEEGDVKTTTVHNRYFTQSRYLLIKSQLHNPNPTNIKQSKWLRRNISYFSLGTGAHSGVIWYERKRKGSDPERYIVVEPNRMDVVINKIHGGILCHQGWHRTHSFVC